MGPGSRSARRATALALLALLVLAPAVAAQDFPVITRPVQGGYDEIYLVNGRVVDADGWPVDQLNLTVEVTGVRDTQVRPATVATNCHGDFVAVFPLGEMKGSPRVRVSVDGAEHGLASVTKTQDVDTFHRTNDFVFTLEESWPHSCGGARDYWKTRMTLWGRIVEGVDAYETDRGTFHARPVNHTALTYGLTTDGRTWYYDDATDERGGFKYSWTMAEDVDAGTVHVRLGDTWHNATVDPHTRIAFFKINTGQEPPAAQAPGPAAALAALVAVAVALGLGGRRRAR